MIAMKRTERGFILGEFRDRYDKACSIQESSLATETCLWLGVHETGRMHLTQDMARDLIPLLQHFVETGQLPKPLKINIEPNSGEAQREG